MSELDRPSWLTADATMLPEWSATPASPARVQSSRATHASPRTYPSALESRVLHRPSFESVPALRHISVVWGLRVTLTPHEVTESDSPDQTLVMAM